MPLIFIETPRLILREWQESDYQPYIDLNADKEVMEYFPSSSRTAEQTMEQIGRIISNMEEIGYGFYAVERKDTHEFIGFTGLTNAPFDSWFTPCVEIGWRFSRVSWGHGFATEAAKSCLQYGFDNFALSEIYSFTSVHNKRSEQVMVRIGMERVGEFDHPKVDKGHYLERHVLYKINRP